VVDVRAEKATVKWKKPDDWQGSDITGYTLEKMDMVIIDLIDSADVISSDVFEYLSNNKCHLPVNLDVN
jgi:hypothetical protein